MKFRSHCFALAGALALLAPMLAAAAPPDPDRMTELLDLGAPSAGIDHTSPPSCTPVIRVAPAYDVHQVVTLGTMGSDVGFALGVEVDDPKPLASTPVIEVAPEDMEHTAFARLDESLAELEFVVHGTPPVCSPLDVAPMASSGDGPMCTDGSNETDAIAILPQRPATARHPRELVQPPWENSSRLQRHSSVISARSSRENRPPLLEHGGVTRSAC